jgi:hypothetical protein
VGSFVRRVKTASGATAVQIVHKRGRDVVGIDHIGSAHDDAALALLLHAARERRHAGQQALELDLDTAPAPDRSGRPVVEATGSLILWDALSSVYDALGFSAVRDEAFRALVLGRIIEPTSKVDTVRVLTEVGVGARHGPPHSAACDGSSSGTTATPSRMPATPTPPAGAGSRWSSTT